MIAVGLVVDPDRLVLLLEVLELVLSLGKVFLHHRQPLFQELTRWRPADRDVELDVEFLEFIDKGVGHRRGPLGVFVLDADGDDAVLLCRGRHSHAFPGPRRHGFGTSARKPSSGRSAR